MPILTLLPNLGMGGSDAEEIVEVIPTGRRSSGLRREEFLDDFDLLDIEKILKASGFLMDTGKIVMKRGA